MPNSSGQTLPNLITSRESTPFFLLQLERTTSNEEQSHTKSSTRGRPRSRLAKLKHIDSYDWKHEPRVTAFAVARRVSIEHRRRNRNDFSQRLFDTNRGLRHSDCFSTTPQWPFYPPLSLYLSVSVSLFSLLLTLFHFRRRKVRLHYDLVEIHRHSFDEFEVCWWSDGYENRQPIPH